MAKEKKLHFNIIDVLIILAFVLLIAAFAFYATGNWQTNSDADEVNDKLVQYTLHADNISEPVAKAIKVGDILKDSSKDTVKGKVIKINTAEKFVNEESFAAEIGDYVACEHPTDYTIDIVVESAYTADGETAMIDDTEIKVGSQLHLKTTGYAFGAYITEVNKTQK